MPGFSVSETVAGNPRWVHRWPETAAGRVKWLSNGVGFV